jgi:hypothetical protein
MDVILRKQESTGGIGSTRYCQQTDSHFGVTVPLLLFGGSMVTRDIL